MSDSETAACWARTGPAGDRHNSATTKHGTLAFINLPKEFTFSALDGTTLRCLWSFNRIEFIMLLS